MCIKSYHGHIKQYWILYIATFCHIAKKTTWWLEKAIIWKLIFMSVERWSYRDTVQSIQTINAALYRGSLAVVYCMWTFRSLYRCSLLYVKSQWLYRCSLLYVNFQKIIAVVYCMWTFRRLYSCGLVYVNIQKAIAVVYCMWIFRRL